MRTHMIFLLIVMSLTACGPSTRDRENYGNLSAEGKVQIDPEQHNGGYKRTECLLCHNIEMNVHQRANNGIDVNALNEAIRTGGESKYCLKCHGTNGTN